MNPKHILAAMLAASALLLAACDRTAVSSPNGSAVKTVPGAIQRVHHAQGETDVPLQPRNVAVLDLGALDSLDALGVEVHGVAGDLFPGHLKKYADRSKYVEVGTLFEPNYEVLSKMAPDLIITGGRSSAKFASLAGQAATIDMPADDARPVQVALDNLSMLAGIFGKQERAAVVTQEVTDQLSKLRELTAQRGRGLILLVSGGKLSAYGAGSRFGVLHSDFGVPPAAEQLQPSLHGEAVGAEFVLKTNPDWLFVIDRDSAIGQAGAARQVLDNPLVRQTTAWEKGQVVYLDPVNWYLVGGGTTALRAMIAQVREAYEKQ